MRKTVPSLTIAVLILLTASCSQPPSDVQTPLNEFLSLISNPENWRFLNVFNAGESRALEAHVIRSSGLVQAFLETLAVIDGYVFTSGFLGGYSYFRLEDVGDIRGKIRNVLIPVDEESGFIPGMVEFARAPDGRIYARYWRTIIDALTGDVLFESAPDVTNGFRGTTPKDRFLVDDFGNIWIGTSEPDDPSPDQNGLYMIPSDFSTVVQILPDPVWQIYMDSAGDVWVVTKKGIYRFTPDGSPNPSGETLWDSEETGMWGEQVVEHEGNLYVLMKNFFDIPPDDRVFELYRLGDEGFERVIEWDSFPERAKYASQMFIFSFGGDLWIVARGNPRVMRVDLENGSVVDEGERFGMVFGQNTVRVVDSGGCEVLVSVGNIQGVAFYNLRCSGESFVLGQTSTSDGLASNYIHHMFHDSTGGRIIVSHLINGYTLIDTESGESWVEFLRAEGFQSNYLMSTGFFRHDGNLYVSATDWIWKMTDAGASPVARLRTNGERIYYHDGRIWSFYNGGCTDDGRIGYYDFSSGRVVANDPEVSDRAEVSIDLGGSYQIYDLVGVDGDTVFIGVGSCLDPSRSFPYVLKYSYSSGSVERVPLPVESRGIFAFALGNGRIYGVTNGAVLEYSGGGWKKIADIQSGGDIRQAVVLNGFMVIVSGWNNSGSGENDCIEVVDLESGESALVKRSDMGIPGGMRNILVVQHEGFKRIWVGTNFGLAYIDVPD